jgi:putative transcriptional regulator
MRHDGNMLGPIVGQLLVATPGLHDANFDRTVVLVLEHSDESSLGVILTRPTNHQVADALPNWEHAIASPAVLFSGGPVDPSAMLALGRCTPHPSTEGIIPVGDDVASVDLSIESPALVAAVHDLRLFGGYAGWGSGQLADEVNAGAWLVCAREPQDVFCSAPDRLWADAMARAHGALETISAAAPQPWLN